MENVNTLHPGNKVNDAPVKKVRSSNTFDEKYALAQGQRFGQLNLCFAFDAVAKDKVTLRSAHNIRSYTLKSPLLSDVSLKKDFFQVTRRAILPLNWEKFFDNPPLGDDVINVAPDCGTSVEDFDEKIAEIMSDLATGVAAKSVDALSTLQYGLYYLIMLSYFYSYGSLLAASGYSMESGYKDSFGNADDRIDTALNKLASLLTSTSPHNFRVYLNGSGNVTLVYADTESAVASGNKNAIGLRRFFELICENPKFMVISAPAGLFNTSPISEWNFSGVTISHVDSCPLDLARLFAYQMVVAHYYTNDSIDFVYSADLYRQVVRAAGQNVNTSIGDDTVVDDDFSYNGINCRYDDCSAHVFDKVYANCGNLSSDPSQIASILLYYSLIFAWRNSLRFTDYFTGAKSRPLAVGDVNIAVNSGSPNYVSVLDVTKNIQRQRFFNAVNRTGRKIEQYLEGIFGAKPSHDWHNPLWLGHTKDTIIADEVENNAFNPSAGTSNAEQLVSASLRGSANNFAFEVQIDEPSIIIGISYFDIPRFYVHASERIMMHKDRFDMFNPFMQFIGDQNIVARELIDDSSFVTNGFGSANPDVFGYTMRHMEYKQRFSRALGPFATGVLPSWLFTDSINGRGDDVVISPDYIRSSCIELDKYYTSLSFYSPANYFHFIVVTYNECGANRNMVFAPNIL